jgi:hypothetical protein
MPVIDSLRFTSLGWEPADNEHKVINACRGVRSIKRKRKQIGTIRYFERLMTTFSPEEGVILTFQFSASYN